MKIHEKIAPTALMLLSSLLVAGCSEPSQPVTATGSASIEEDAATATAAQPPVDSVTPVELSQDERALPMTPDTACNLERANATVFAGVPVEVSKAGGAARVSGWVADQVTRGVPADADLRMVGVKDNRAWKIGVKTGINRDDVVKLLGGETGYASAGYGATVDFSGMPSGSYRMYTVFAGSDGLLRVCDNGRSIIVAD